MYLQTRLHTCVLFELYVIAYLRDGFIQRSQAIVNIISKNNAEKITSNLISF